MYFLDHIWLIPLFPAIGAVCMFFFGRKLSKQAVSGICVGAVVLAFAWACLAVWQYTGYSAAHPGKPFEKVLYTWMGTGNYVLSSGAEAPDHLLAGDAGLKSGSALVVHAVHERAQFARARRMPQLAQCLGLDLADALAGDRE